MKTRALAIMFVSTLALLSAVNTAVSAARYHQASPADPAVLSDDSSDPKLFEKVAFYPDRNLARALTDLRVMKNRVCLIVPQGDTYENERKGQIARSDRTTEFMLIMADRDFSIDAGQLGSTPRSPGILNLKDLAVDLLVKKSFVVESQVVYFAPSAGAVVQLDWKEDRAPAADMKGRECWHQLFIANAGTERTEIGRRT